MDKVNEIREKTRNADEFYLESAVGLSKKELAWLIEQAEIATKYRNSLENISEILDGQFATELVERIAYELVHSGIYDKGEEVKRGKLIGYTGESCTNCSRERVEKWENGDKICEKCNWNQNTNEYE